MIVPLDFRKYFMSTYLLFLQVYVCMPSYPVVSDSVTPWAVTHQAPLSMEISRQEYWSGLPCPPPGDLPDPGIKAISPTLQVDFLPSEPPGKPKTINSELQIKANIKTLFIILEFGAVRFSLLK